MALSTLQRLKLVAPDFGADYTDPELEDYIEMAAEQVSAQVFGDMYQQAVALLAAHSVALASKTGQATGPLTSERAGEVSRSYGFSAQDQSELAATTYGQEFERIRRSRVGTKIITTHPVFDDA